jgi:PAS domain S-box-containing protein
MLPKKKANWMWIVGFAIVLSGLVLVALGVVDIERWGVMLMLIYVSNILFAGLTLRSLYQLRVNRELLKNKALEMEEDRAKDRALLGGLGEGIVVTDGNGDVELINHEAEVLIGWKNEEVVGKKWYEVAPLQDESGNVIPPEKRATQKVLLSGKPTYSSVNYYVRRDGSRFAVGTTAAPVVVGDKTVGVIAVFRDISKERDVDRAKTEFVSLASHQLRTPLSIVKWYAEMLVNGDAGPLNIEQTEFVHCLYDSNERMIELVNSLLSISRIESGRIKIDPVATDLGELVKQLVKELQPKITARKLELVESIHQTLPKIMVDPKLVRQVYLNLLTNAIKYTPEKGTITIIISSDGEMITSQVSDNGCGIPVGDQKKIFERFFRAPNAAAIDADGTGLGLYLVKTIVESSHGRVWFESEENKGTSFWFTLPLTGMESKKGEVAIDS